MKPGRGKHPRCELDPYSSLGIEVQVQSLALHTEIGVDETDTSFDVRTKRTTGKGVDIVEGRDSRRSHETVFRS